MIEFACWLLTGMVLGRLTTVVYDWWTRRRQ